MNIELILLVTIIVISYLILIFIIYQNNLRQQLYFKDIIHKNEVAQNSEIDILKQHLSDEMIRFQSMLSNNINDDLNRLNENTANKLSHIEKGVNEGLIFGFNKTNESYANVLKQIEKINEASNTLKDLSGNIMDFQNILTDKKTRGIYGEVTLYSLLQTIYLDNNNFYLKQHKLSNGNVVDCLLINSKPLGNIAIDAKFPLENYNRLFDNSLNQDNVKSSFKKDIIKHINDIKNKYIISGETAEIAFMFIPAEAVFSKIYGEFPEVVDASYKARVYLVSPTTIMAYITAIQAINLDQKRSEKVIEIQEEFNKLSQEFNRFSERLIILNKDFKKVYNDMSDVAITTDKIINKFKKIESVDLKRTPNETV